MTKEFFKENYPAVWGKLEQGEIPQSSALFDLLAFTWSEGQRVTQKILSEVQTNLAKVEEERNEIEARYYNETSQDPTILASMLVEQGYVGSLRKEIPHETENGKVVEVINLQLRCESKQ